MHDQFARTDSAVIKAISLGPVVRLRASLVIAGLLGLFLLSRTSDACGTLDPAAPHGRVLPELLTDCSEDGLLGAERRPALYAVKSRDGRYHPKRAPMVFVHGINGHPSDFGDLMRELGGGAHQPYVLVFDDLGRALSENGSGFAREIRTLFSQRNSSPRTLTIIAHSAGGIVSRHALNLLSHGGDLHALERVDFFALDTPWHGYHGPSDQSALGRLRISIARPFLPAGILDLRAESALFQGDPSSPNPVLRAGLLRYPLPPQVRVHLYFAENGDSVEDYTEGFLSQLGEKIAAYYHRHVPVRGDARLRNFWRAIIGTHAYFLFQEELRLASDRELLTPPHVQAALLKHFPRFAGDHASILRLGVTTTERNLALQIRRVLGLETSSRS